MSTFDRVVMRIDRYFTATYYHATGKCHLVEMPQGVNLIYVSVNALFVCQKKEAPGVEASVFSRSILLAAFDDVAAKVFLGLYIEDVFAELGVILAELQRVRRVLCVFARVIMAAAAFFRNQTYYFAFIAFFSHFLSPHFSLA